ncbi:MAG: hypothetical protein LBN08_04765 [Lactobacillales bacterium]|nr:hypothetical protein [Lactobacillales bacterium]
MRTRKIVAGLFLFANLFVFLSPVVRAEEDSQQALVIGSKIKISKVQYSIVDVQIVHKYNCGFWWQADDSYVEKFAEPDNGDHLVITVKAKNKDKKYSKTPLFDDCVAVIDGKEYEAASDYVQGYANHESYYYGPHALKKKETKIYKIDFDVPATVEKPDAIKIGFVKKLHIFSDNEYSYISIKGDKKIIDQVMTPEAKSLEERQAERKAVQDSMKATPDDPEYDKGWDDGNEEGADWGLNYDDPDVEYFDDAYDDAWDMGSDNDDYRNGSASYKDGYENGFYDGFEEYWYENHDE